MEICCAVLNKIKQHWTSASQHDKASAWLPLKHCIAPLIKLAQKIKAVSTGYTDSDEPSGESSRDDLCKETGNDLTFCGISCSVLLLL